MFRLKTVRSKLAALVCLPIVVTLASLPILSWLLQRQLIDQADDRVVEAEKAFRTEFRDSILDLRLAASVIATDSDTHRALVSKDVAILQDLGDDFAKVYPEIDILFVDAQGSIVSQLGCMHPPSTLSAIPEITAVLTGQEVRTVTRHGCEVSPDSAPAYMIAAPVKGGGAVVVCLPINRLFLDNAGQKFGLQLATFSPGQSETIVTTSKFLKEATFTTLDTPIVLEVGDRVHVAIRWEPESMKGMKDSFAMAAVLDVTDIRTIVRWNLLKVMLILFVAASVSVFMGWRVASVMSSAIKRVNTALKKLEQQEYAHVIGVKTGDELEDLADGFNSMVDGLKERDKLRTTFGKYVTSAVVDHLMSGKVELGGASIPVTILFTDIRSFTTISEKMDAQALVGLLNEYFTEMVGIVMEEDGVVDKYIGDAIMAVFGAPVPKKDDPIRAVRAAVRMRQALVHLNARLKERGIAPLRTGIGLHTGVVVAGNIGSEKRMEYTVIGDPVNLASRLESSTKDLGVAILISDDTYELVKEKIDARAVKEITVKGRLKPVMTYEVLGIKGEAPLQASDLPSGRLSEPVLSS